MNGAIAIADVLGIYGREGVYLATYWRTRRPGVRATSPSRCTATTTAAARASPVWPWRPRQLTSDTVGSYAAIDHDRGLLRVMLINKAPDAM